MTEPYASSEREKEGGLAVLVVIAGLLVLAAAGYLAAYLVVGDKVPHRTTVAGVEIGGLSPDDAERALREGLADREDRAITVVVDDQTVEIRPADAGLSVDYAASVAEAGGAASWSPGHLWDYVAGGYDLDAVVTVDDAALDGALDRLAQQVDTAPQDGDIRFRGSQIVVVDPVPGEGLDQDAAREALVGAYLSDDKAPVVLPAGVVRPDVDAADVRSALDEFANPAMSGPVTLLFGDTPVRLEPGDVAAVLRMSPQDGALVPDVDEDDLLDLVGGLGGLGEQPVDATVALVDGAPTVVPAEPGVTYEAADVEDALLEVLTRRDGKREIDVVGTPARATFTTAKARALKIEEQVSTFTTTFPYSEDQNTILGRAAAALDGTVVKSGETLSLNDTIGDPTASDDFLGGFVVGGAGASAPVGDASQLATTLFNTMLLAGLEDVERTPNPVYLDRYPVGLDATLSGGATDLRFRNDTPYGVLVSVQVTPSTPSADGVVTVSMYSTKHRDVTLTTSERTDVTAPGTQRLSGADCRPSPGSEGFDVDVTRVLRKVGNGQVARTETLHTHYEPADRVICTRGR